MVFQKLIRIFIACFLFQLVGCITTATKFDPKAVPATDKIGVWSTYSKPEAITGLAPVFIDSLKKRKNEVLKTILDLELHDVVEELFIQKSLLVTNGKYQKIDSKDIVVGTDNKPDLLATAESLALDKVIIINTAATVTDTTYEYKPYWRPQLEVSGKMLNVYGGKVLWRGSIVMANRLIPRFEAIDTKFDKSFNNLAVKTVARLVVSKHPSSKIDNSLQIAAGKGNLEVVKTRIIGGENVNSADIIGQTALMYASEQGRIEVVKYLVENGAYVNMKSEPRGRGTALIYAAATNRITVMDYLLKHGAEINAATHNKETALFWATAMGHVKAVNWLFNNNADTKLKNKDGKTALDIAVELNQEEIELILTGK